MPTTYEARFMVAKTGGLVDAIQRAIQASPSILTGGELLSIGSRETGFLWATHWTRFHNWAILGDEDHGHGVFQIDDRSHSDFTSTDLWKDPYENALKAIEIYKEGKNEVDLLINEWGFVATDMLKLKETYFSAYNCGPKNALLGWKNHNKPSIFTTDENYGSDVLNQVGIYTHLLGGD